MMLDIEKELTGIDAVLGLGDLLERYRRNKDTASCARRTNKIKDIINVLPKHHRERARHLLYENFKEESTFGDRKRPAGQDSRFNLCIYIERIGFPNDRKLIGLRNVLLGDYDKQYRDRFVRLGRKINEMAPASDPYDIDYLYRIRNGIETGVERGRFGGYTAKARSAAENVLRILDEYIRKSEAA